MIFYQSISISDNFNLRNVRWTTHGIDSVVLLTDVVTNSQLPALRIHFTDFAQ